MSYFDEWIDSYFSKKDGDAIYAIGCWSYGSTRKKGEAKVREDLKSKGISSEVVNEFIKGAFDRCCSEHMPLEKMLERINFRSLEAVHNGTGWTGTRYVLHTFNFGSSPLCETLQEIKQWIIKYLRWQLR